LCTCFVFAFAFRWQCGCMFVHCVMSCQDAVHVFSGGLDKLVKLYNFNTGTGEL